MFTKALPPSSVRGPGLGVCALVEDAPASRSPVISSIELVVFFINVLVWVGKPKTRAEARERGVMVTRTSPADTVQLSFSFNKSIQIHNCFGYNDASRHPR